MRMCFTFTYSENLNDPVPMYTFILCNHTVVFDTDENVHSTGMKFYDEYRLAFISNVPALFTVRVIRVIQ
jgi:hypothetical protein